MDSFIKFADTLAGSAVLSVLALLISLTVVIFIHEMGHYLVARYFGVKVEKFSLGFGVEVWGRTDKHGTRWSWSFWPLGGYIKIFGNVNPENPEIWDAKLKKRRRLTAKELKVAFCSKPVWQRALIVAAGPAINVVLAVAILFALFLFQGQVSTQPIVTAIAEGTAGQDAGFQLGDEIIAVDGQPIERFEDIWEKTRLATGQIYAFTVLREGREVTLHAASRAVDYRDKKGIHRAHGRLGVTNIYGVELEDIVLIDGVTVDGNEELIRQTLLEKMGREIRIAVRPFAGQPMDTFRFRGLPEFNTALNDPAHEDYDMFFTRVTDKKLYVRHTPGEAFYYTLKQIALFFDEAFKILELIFTGGGKGEDIVGGVATLGDAAGDAAQDGIYTFFVFIAVLSIQIAIINLLPVPLLDGGYLIFLAYEALRGRPLPERVQDYAFSFGLFFIVCLAIFANLTDVIKLF